MVDGAMKPAERALRYGGRRSEARGAGATPMVDGAMKPAERALRYGGRRSEARGAGATPMVNGAVTPTGTPAAPLLLSGGLVGGRRQDVAIRDGRIERAGAGLDASGYQRLDVTDRLVLPGFVESHIHPDKAFIADRTQGLRAGGPTPQTLVAELKKAFTVDDVYRRARRVMELAVRHGCTTMRAHVEIDAFVELRARVIDRIREAGIHVISLPATELHVKARTDARRTWRGVTRIGELREAGVNVSISTNNIVNPFTPYGHPDLLRQALVTAMAAHLGNLDQLAWLPELITTNPARALGLEGYGLAAGCRADLVVLDARDAAQAITEQAEKLYVVKAGRVVARNTRTHELSIDRRG